MKRIVKGPEPVELTEYRSRPGARYDGDNEFPRVKNAIRKSLVKEQRGNCCFCEQSISDAANTMRVAHRIPQSVAKAEDLCWRNLLGTCTGNEGNGDPHCDVSQGSKEIKLDPTSAEHIATISFAPDLKITSSRADLDKEINDILRLNCDTLLRARVQARSEYITIRKMKCKGTINRKTLERWRDAIYSTSQGKLPPFAGMLYAWLDRLASSRP